MNRCKISLCILAALVLLCTVSLPIIHTQCKTLQAGVERVETAVEAGDTALALTEFGRLEAEWEQFHKITGLFVDGEKFDPIREVLHGLRPLIEAEHPEAMSELERLRGLAESIYEEELPDWSHLL